FQALDVEGWKELFNEGEFDKDLDMALKNSQLVKWQFGAIAQTGLMIPRNLPGKERQPKQLKWSGDILFDVLAEREPDHPMMEQAYHECKHTFLDQNRAANFLRGVIEMNWELLEVPAVSPFAFGLYASKIKESMMMENPEEAIERLYEAMKAKISGLSES
ncbi:MAG: helicase, partial [Verrucomicrobiota bacterium]